MRDNLIKMKEIQNHAGVGSPNEGILSIFCVDSLEVKARVTFDSSVVQGIRVTYWQPEAPDSMENVLEDIFGILFEEVVKARRMKLLESEVGMAKL